jgi:hypothetical protein
MTCRQVDEAYPNTIIDKYLSCDSSEFVTGGGGYCGGCDIYGSAPAGIRTWWLYCAPGCSGGNGYYRIDIVCCKVA